MMLGIPYDSDEGRAHRGALTAMLCGRRIRGRAPRWRRRRARSRASRKNREPMLRVMRKHRDAAYRVDGRQRARRGRRPAGGAPSTAPRGARGLGRRGRARRALRLPQRAGDRARADRHDRPADGLRHDRHRARLRAREVQEARRRRATSRSSTSRVPAALEHARLRPTRRSPTSSRYVRGTNTLHGRAARQPRRRCSRRASPTREHREGREARSPGVFDVAQRVRAVGARRRTPTSGSAIAGERARRSPAFSLLSDFGLTRGADRGGQRRRSSAA